MSIEIRAILETLDGNKKSYSYNHIIILFWGFLSI
jgi:hypothetical protein